MADTRLILHVKGTESETTELPKDAVRTGLSEGKITNSQLIWSPADNAWKQASEHPALVQPVENLILHVKGTESETRHVPKKAVRQGISQGQITHSQLIWSAPENAWKQVREMPELLPSQKLAPAPSVPHPSETPEAVPVAAAPAAEAVPAVAHAPSALTGSPKPKPSVVAPQPKIGGSGNVPKVAAAGTAVPKVAAAGATPKVAVSAKPKAAAARPRVSAAAGSPSVRANAVGGRSTGSIEVEEEDGFHPFKWICFGLAGLILLILGANYFLVQMPLSAKFGKSGFNNVTLYAHLGAFIQPNVMVIHIPTNAKLTEDNLPGFLAALAKSTPANPLSRAPFSRVAITNGWTAQYSFDGQSWKQMADLESQEFAQRKDMIVDQLDDAAGRSLFEAGTLNEEAQQAKRNKIWKEFVAHFAVEKQ